MKTISIDEFIEKHYKKIIIIFLILILVSRIYKFGELPLTIGVDEAGAAYDAYALANYGVDRYLNSYPVYLINFGGGQSALYAYLNALLIKLTGQDNIFISRLPELLMFLMAIFVSYKLVEKKQDRKTAIVFTLLIIVCPWLIMQSRGSLDCYLLGPMFIFDLYLLENAKKSWHYIIAGISVGITLYTYSLSWIMMPAFLLAWAIYHLYTKTTTTKNVIILAIAVFIFALPLILFLLSNMRIINIEKIGIFTIPKLFKFRSREISILNIFIYGFDSIETIFLSKNTLYYFEIPFFIVGLIVGIKDLYDTSKKREYSFLAFMTLSFLIILLMNLLKYITSTTHCNILYVPIMYFTAIGILRIIKNREILWVIIIAIYALAFTIFEINYYKEYSKTQKHQYEDIYLTRALEYIENNIKGDKEVYIYTYGKAEPYIYALLKDKISPYEFNQNIDLKKRKLEGENYEVTIQRMENYYFNEQEITKEYDEDRVYIVNKVYNVIVDFLQKIGYESEEFEEYYILK